jgi:hypothetical protein
VKLLGKHQRDLLGKMAGIWLALVVGDKVSASLVKRGLLTAEPDGSMAHITPAGLRLIADEIDAERLTGFSVDRLKLAPASEAPP